MANRHTLPVIYYEDFKAWLVTDGWQIQEPKGDYEVLRATKNGRKHPLLVYCRNATNGGKELVHYTVLDRDMGVVMAFLKDDTKRVYNEMKERAEEIRSYGCKIIDEICKEVQESEKDDA